MNTNFNLDSTLRKTQMALVSQYINRIGRLTSPKKSRHKTADEIVLDLVNSLYVKYENDINNIIDTIFDKSLSVLEEIFDPSSDFQKDIRDKNIDIFNESIITIVISPELASKLENEIDGKMDLLDSEDNQCIDLDFELDDYKNKKEKFDKLWSYYKENGKRFVVITQKNSVPPSLIDIELFGRSESETTKLCSIHNYVDSEKPLDFTLNRNYNIAEKYDKKQDIFLSFGTLNVFRLNKEGFIDKFDEVKLHEKDSLEKISKAFEI